MLKSIEYHIWNASKPRLSKHVPRLAAYNQAHTISEHSTIGKHMFKVFFVVVVEVNIAVSIPRCIQGMEASIFKVNIPIENI